MRLQDFDFDLPERLIALRPVHPRPAARLLVAEGERTRDAHVRDLPEILRPGDRLVFNDTRVIPARLDGLRQRAGAEGARVEVTLMEALPDGNWTALARPLKKLRPGDRIAFAAGLAAEVAARGPDRVTLAFDRSGADFDAALAAAGAMPLPPYIAAKRAPDAQDATDYQTIFARRPGAVAAPTAALHFDAALMDALAARGIVWSTVTLHVGAGTFLPVKVEDIATHRMHAEWGEITAEAAEGINATRAAGGRIIPVGTTALRLLESAADPAGLLAPWSGETDIFIRPGHAFRCTDGLMTNFHLPKSTLMMLVSALMGTGRIRALYAHAVAAGYRFFSYGDASLLIPERR
jgi:S-adenosylmethionine:tRNA ribosyltransferase-isomerase